MEDLDDRVLETALGAAREAAAIHRSESARPDPATWREKERSDFVTEVDLAAERAIVQAVGRRFPTHEILAEEGTQAAGGGAAGGDRPRGAAGGGERGEPGRPREASGPPSSMRWIIDPLDGTTNWLHGYPEYAVSIAVLDGEGTRVGVVLNSATGETFHAVRGRGAFRDGERIRTSEVSEARLALVGTGFPFKRPDLIGPYLRTLEAMLRRTSGVRRGGSAALDLCDLACGRLDGFWELWLMPWDVAAGALILREAGGAFTPLELRLPGISSDTLRRIREGGRAFRRMAEAGARATPGPGAYLGGNGRLEDALREILRSR